MKKMQLLIKRRVLGDNYTIGDLYIDNEFFCNTLEDADRGLINSMSEPEIAKLKIKGKTAIPKGTYKLNMNIVSPRFSKVATYNSIEGKLPRLEEVPGFSGILIHIGNYHTDTDGCILVGEDIGKNYIANSKVTFFKLYEKLKEFNGLIYIKIQ